MSVNSKLNTDLSNIAKNLGETKSEFLRKKIREKLARFPEEFKSHQQDRKSEIKITGLSSEFKEQINMVSKNLGLKKNSFMISLLNEIASEYPDQMKRPRAD